MYFNYDILSCILDKINNFDDKINFCKVDKELYLKNYENIIKFKIKKYIYKDYTRFYRYLNRYYYNINELTELIRYTLIYLSSQTIWMNQTCGTYDLRFIFELLSNENNIEDKQVEKLHYGFYNHFYFHLKNSIVKKNREKTKSNLQNISILTVLHNNFYPYRQKNKESNNYIKLH